MVKWISFLVSAQAFWVRVLVGTQNKKTTHLGGFLILCAYGTCGPELKNAAMLKANELGTRTLSKF